MSHLSPRSIPSVLNPRVEADYLAVIRRHAPASPVPEQVESYAFYERTKKAFVLAMTSETRQYGNIILKKGVTPVIRPLP